MFHGFFCRIDANFYHFIIQKIVNEIDIHTEVREIILTWLKKHGKEGH